MRRKGTWLNRIVVAVVLTSGLPLGKDRALGCEEDGHAGISSPTAGSPGGLPDSSHQLEAVPGLLASSMIAAWDSDQDRSLAGDEFKRAALCFFELADTKRNKRLTVEEILEALSRLTPESGRAPAAGSPPVTPPSDVPSGIRTYAYLTESLLNSADSNGDNEITSREWKAAARTSFELWDLNGNGRLEQTELQQIFAICLRLL